MFTVPFDEQNSNSILICLLRNFGLVYFERQKRNVLDYFKHVARSLQHLCELREKCQRKSLQTIPQSGSQYIANSKLPS